MIYRYQRKLCSLLTTYQNCIRSREYKNLMIMHRQIHTGRSVSCEFKQAILSDEFVHNLDLDMRQGRGKHMILQGKVATQLQEAYISDFIAKVENPSANDWHALFEKIFAHDKGSITEYSIDGKIMEVCHHAGRLDAARLYIDFMKEAKRKYKAATLIEFIRVCYQNRESVTKEDLKKVGKFCKYLMNKYDSVLDAAIGEGIIKGLMLINDYEKISETIRKISEQGKPNSGTFCAAIECYLNNDKINEARLLMAKMMDERLTVREQIYVQWINKFAFDEKRLAELLMFFKHYEIIPQQNTCDHLIHTFSNLPEEAKLYGTYTEISESGVCPNCNESLNRIALSEDEFKDLRSLLLEKVLVGKDIFGQTTPKELSNFFMHVKQNAPFDVVIDGLNTIYINGAVNKTGSYYSRLLTDVVKHFVDRNQTVYILGRKHMSKFPEMDYVYENAKLFLLNDVSVDDPFILYATMYSGRDTYFVTRDYMRSEKFKLENSNFFPLFKRWQLSHQIFITFIAPSGRVYTRSPSRFQAFVQRNGSGWHIPFYEQNQVNDNYLGQHKTWLCLKK